MFNMNDSNWRSRPQSKRRKLLTAMARAEGSIRSTSVGRARQCYFFFADFWESTPHPIAQMALVITWAAIVVTLNDGDVLDAKLTLDSSAGTTLTAILAFLIVFRTNQSYNRWWEGRILWGKMHASCVELSQLAAAWIDNPRLARRIMSFSVAFAYTVKKVLRREPLSAEDLDGIVEPAEVTRMESLSLQAKPYYCTDVIRQCIKRGLTESPQSFGVQAVARGIDIPIAQLSMQYADMVRVRNTPQPDCFRVMLQMFTIIYLLLLPVISYEALGYWVIPEVLLTSFLMLGLQLAASNLEDPFGYDLSDLELDLYVSNIASQCREAFYIGEKKGFDLTIDDGGAAAADPSGAPDHLQEEDDSADSRQNTEPMGGRDEGQGIITSMGWTTSPSPESIPLASPSPSGSMPKGGAAVASTASVADGGNSSSSGRAALHRRSSSQEQVVSAVSPAVSARGAFCVPSWASAVFPKASNVTEAEATTMTVAAGYEEEAATGGSSLRRGRSSDRSARNASKSPGKTDDTNGGGGISGRFVIRNLVQEQQAPRRHSKRRPGRGKSPLVEEGHLVLPPPPELQQYNFEQHEADLRAAIV